MATESIPGCVLQLFVWFTNPEQAGTYALVSIGISALTTGYSSAVIAFDLDLDVNHRKNQPKFYGYIPADNTLRGRCFILMTLIGAIHNMSRCVGLALLLASPSRRFAVYFVVGEVTLYVGERASRSNTRRGNLTAYSNRSFCDRQVSRRDAICLEAKRALTVLISNSLH